MANIKISELTSAAAALTTQQFEVNEAGTSKKVTGQQILDLVDANLGSLAQQDSSSISVTGGSIVGITDLAIADGGTGASNAQAARNNLLPSQTGNANKFLKSDGTNVSWDATGITDGDRGDISVTGDGSIWTIDSNAITTTKILDSNVTTAKLSTTGVTAGAYGSATEIPVVTVDSKGRITSMATEALVVTGTLIGYQVYTSSGTYTKATNNPSFVIVEGAGGGGGATSSGGTSSFGSHISITGGNTNGTAGVGSGGDINSTGQSGDYNYTAPAGGFLTVTATANGGLGVLYYYGTGAKETTTSSPGGSATAQGGGSSGYSKKLIQASSLASSETVTIGGAGGGGSPAATPGIVIVWEYK
jgi:hypothetical protein